MAKSDADAAKGCFVFKKLKNAVLEKWLRIHQKESFPVVEEFYIWLDLLYLAHTRARKRLLIMSEIKRESFCAFWKGSIPPFQLYS